jgi:hypothetical protein
MSISWYVFLPERESGWEDGCWEKERIVLIKYVDLSQLHVVYARVRPTLPVLVPVQPHTREGNDEGNMLEKVFKADDGF